ncbi:MAG: carboxymuconolactone decarboxylase family protein [Alphaproteobacteria bacterium]|nr:carboxymuconolactone decarboxylase family protein [Alphaproteobacteria bacterium]
MRVQPKPLNRYPWFIRLFFAKQKRTYGKVLDPGLLWGRSKWVFSTLALLYGALNRESSPLDPAFRSMVTVRISQINHCAFCVDVNAATLEKRGVGEEKILSLHGWRESTLFTAAERAALDYAEAVTYTDGEITDGLFTELKEHFDDDAVIELTGLIAFQNMSSKFNAALDIPPQGFCHVPNLEIDGRDRRA